MIFNVQAILGDASDGKLGINIKTHRDLLKLVGKDAPGQIALLIALEYFLAVTSPGQVNQVSSHSLGWHVCLCPGIIELPHKQSRSGIEGTTMVIEIP